MTAIKICPGKKKKLIPTKLIPIFFLIVAGQARQSRSFSFILSEDNRRLLATHNAADDRPPYQIRFYCGRYTGHTEKLQVEFPGICELKINENVIPGHVSKHSVIFILLLNNISFFFLEFTMFEE